jgi:uncharacterized protein (TIGR02722 family)
MKSLVILLVGFVLILTGCTSPKVIREDVNKPIDISGRWNDTDARMVADEMINECLSGLWINEFNKSSGHTPTVIVGTIQNNSYEHINPDVFISELQKALINSGKVSFVANKNERGEIRDERADQQMGNTNPATITSKGMETGADFMLRGSINAVEDAVKGRYVMFYQVNIELIDLKTNQKRWIGQKEIKKRVERSSVSI